MYRLRLGLALVFAIAGPAAAQPYEKSIDAGRPPYRSPNLAAAERIERILGAIKGDPADPQNPNAGYSSNGLMAPFVMLNGTVARLRFGFHRGLIWKAVGSEIVRLEIRRILPNEVHRMAADASIIDDHTHRINVHRLRTGEAGEIARRLREEERASVDEATRGTLRVSLPPIRTGSDAAPAVDALRESGVLSPDPERAGWKTDSIVIALFNLRSWSAIHRVLPMLDRKRTVRVESASGNDGILLQMGISPWVAELSRGGEDLADPAGLDELRKMIALRWKSDPERDLSLRVLRWVDGFRSIATYADLAFLDGPQALRALDRILDAAKKDVIAAWERSEAKEFEELVTIDARKRVRALRDRIEARLLGSGADAGADDIRINCFEGVKGSLADRTYQSLPETEEKPVEGEELVRPRSLPGLDCFEYIQRAKGHRKEKRTYVCLEYSSFTSDPSTFERLNEDPLPTGNGTSVKRIADVIDVEMKREHPDAATVSILVPPEQCNCRHILVP